jgi:hypothetical protein
VVVGRGGGLSRYIYNYIYINI